jgi:hypothetical protein
VGFDSSIDPGITVAGLLVGFVVGLTGMGGGALMTPVLVLLFGVQPLAAVSSDIVASFVMKPVGAAVHARRGTVRWSLVRWLVLGSVPTAFLGVLLLRALGDGEHVQEVVRLSLGVALLLATGCIVVKAYLQMRQLAADRRVNAAGGTVPDRSAELVVRPLPTVLIGALGGLVVGMTSVGSGSLILVLLMLMHPRLRPSSLVGTDLVQAVPLVGSAAVAHLMFGDFQLALMTSLLIGCLPGVYLGARASTAAPPSLVKRVLVVVLCASGLKLVHVGTVPVLVAVTAVALLLPAVWAVARVHQGLPARPRRPSRPVPATTGS